jgi:hypothetical protein
MRRDKVKHQLLKECRRMSRENNVIPPNRVQNYGYKRKKYKYESDTEVQPAG